jgi:hypothetical protein
MYSIGCLLDDTLIRAKIFDVRYDNELAHEYYGDGKRLADRYSTPAASSSTTREANLTMQYRMRQIYHDKGLTIPDKFDSTMTHPPIHFMQYASYAR